MLAVMRNKHMGSRLLRRAVRRRTLPRVNKAVSESSGPCHEDMASLSCPAPFCPIEGSAGCQSEAAIPADCAQRQRPMGGCPTGMIRPHSKNIRKPPSLLDMSHRMNYAHKAWNDDVEMNVNKFTRRKPARGEEAPHPLAIAAGQWQRQARRAREDASVASSSVEGSALPVALPCSAAGQEGIRQSYSEDAAPRPLPSVWRQAAQEELRAWRRPARRSSCSPTPAGDDAAIPERRLNKVIAEAGCCSRRKADELIFAGRVSVNGEVETQAGRRISLDDRVSVDGRPLARSQRMLYLMLHKPVQVVSTAADPQGRQTVLSLVAREYPGIRLFPVGRLDYFSEGLILLTNDGRLAQRLMHPRHHLPKHYEVLVRNVVTQKALQCMRSGMQLAEGEELLPVEVTARSTASGCTLLRMTLRQGVNRQIRRMCRDLGLTILRLRRVAIGPLQLGKLGAGQFRQLEDVELAQLRHAVGLL